MRLNKYVSHSGLGTRRQAAELIRKGKISVNGVVNTNPAFILSGKDVISYKGKTIAVTKEKVYLLMNKPKNFTCDFDREKQKSVANILYPKESQILYVPMPLSQDDLGLIILTNDEMISSKLKVKNSIKQSFEIFLDREFLVADLKFKNDEIKNIAFVSNKDNNIVALDSYNRDPAKIDLAFKSMGYQVLKKDRLTIGGLTKKDLPRGFWRKLTTKEIIFIRHFY